MVLYPVVIVLSAFLLFLVQPLMGKVLLPWFGGGASVWSASVLFFQVLLLIGHAYSHGITERLSRRRQTGVHVGLLAVSLAGVLVTALTWRTPLMPGPAWQPQGAGDPLVRILAILTVSVGLPYFVLSTTSPLLQRWALDEDAWGTRASPYPLYALSNLGSLVALLGYPTLVQPNLELPIQSWVWTAGYGLFVVGVGALAWRQSRTAERPRRKREPPVPPGAAPDWPQRLMWLLLSTTASVLLLATTRQMTENVAAVPLLWVVLLALYLLTFVIVFSGKHSYRRGWLLLFFFATMTYRGAIVRAGTLPVVIQLYAFGLLLFAGALACHGEMVKLRPAPRYLTQFYLIVALGGALGGVLVNFAAPWAFDSTWELPLSIIVAWIAVAVAQLLDEGSPLYTRFRVPMTAMLVVALWLSVQAFSNEIRLFRFSTLTAHRNFYGVLRVQEEDRSPSDVYRLVHGATIHGVQYEEAVLRTEPIGYFSPSSGIGRQLAHMTDRAGRLKVGVLGLGAGTLATYGRDGDVYHFYEIDPQVIEYAQGQGGYFSYLDDSAAQIEVVLGDARLSLARALRDGGGEGYDLLILDVFSGDAVPVHLLTREAFEVYLAHLEPGGALAANISTSHLNMRPLLALLADRFDLRGVVIEDEGDGAMRYASFWVLMARDPAVLVDGASSGDVTELSSFYEPDMRLWTDTYSNLLPLLR
jgi:hypothetical protein